MASSEPVDGRCAAKVTAGGYCEKHPMAGQRRCGTHGGRAPQAKAAAERRQQEAAVVKAVQTFGLRRDIGPEEALLEELQWTAGHVAWLRDRVMELDPGALVWGRTSEVSKEATEFPGVDTTREAAPNVWLVLYERQQKHLLALIDTALKSKLDERRVRLAERQGAQVAEVIRRSFDQMLARLVALGLGQALVEQWPLLMREVVVVELRALAGGTA